MTLTRAVGARFVAGVRTFEETFDAWRLNLVLQLVDGGGISSTRFQPGAWPRRLGSLCWGIRLCCRATSNKITCGGQMRRSLARLHLH